MVAVILIPKNRLTYQSGSFKSNHYPNLGNGSNYKSKTTIINESGLYSLILSGKHINDKYKGVAIRDGITRGNHNQTVSNESLSSLGSKMDVLAVKTKIP